MELTFIGVAQVAIGGLLLLFGSTPAMFVFVLACGLMGGSGALLLPALGGSSIPPIQFALPFLIARLVLPGGAAWGVFAQGVRANIFYLTYVAYAVAAATLAPRIFRGDMEVPPLRFRGLTYIFDTVPLAPSSQNLTTAVYLVGGLLLALCAYAVCTRDGAPRTMVAAGVAIGGAHAALGIAGVAFAGTPVQELLNAFRNGAYAQVDQAYRGFIRINGIFPEPSGYAAYALVWFVFLFECWFRGVRPRATGRVALLLLLVLVFSTSSSAYVGLAGYAALFMLRTLVVPDALRLGRALPILGFGLAGLIGVLAAAVLLPSFAAEFGDMFSRMTVEKSGSTSGLQRAFWARKGLEAFFVSHGLGIGAGSFRSSSLFSAILGSAGVIGIFTFVAHALRVLQPLRRTTYAPSGDERLAVGAAAAWAAFALLIPAAVAAPSADPGGDFAIFAGAALGLRAYRRGRSNTQPYSIPDIDPYHRATEGVSS